MPTRPSDPAALLRELIARVEAAEQVMVAKVAAALAKGDPQAPDWVLKKQVELQSLRSALQRDAEALARGLQRDIPLVVGGAFDWGAADAAQDVSEATGGPAPALGEGTVPAARLLAVQAIAQDILRAVDNLPQAVLRNATDAYQRVVAQGVSSVLLGAETRRQVTQRAVNQLLGEGIHVFTDRRGRNWSLPTYVEMATRTGVAKAAVDGHVEVLRQSGFGFVHIIPGPYPCPVCDVWASKVLRRDATVDGDEPSLEDARAAGWGHPNCRCSVALWVEGFSELVTERPSREGYEDDQEQRRIERGIRKWKLREATALSPGEKARARAKVREWQGEMREHLAAHPGLKRQPKREALFRGSPTPPSARGPVPTTPTAPVAPVAPPVAPPRVSATLGAGKRDAFSFGVDEEQAKFVAEFESVVGKALDGTGLVIRNTRASSSNEYAFSLFHESNEFRPVGSITRTFSTDDRGRTVVHNDLFRLSKSEQGKGVGTKVTRALEDWYRASGVHRMELDANIDVGGYTWAKAGYEWDPQRETPKRVAGFLDALEERGGDSAIIAKWRETVLTRPMDEWVAPYDLAMLGWSEGATTWVGKEFMLEQFWAGVKYL